MNFIFLFKSRKDKFFFFFIDDCSTVRRVMGLILFFVSMLPRFLMVFAWTLLDASTSLDGFCLVDASTLFDDTT